MAFREVLVVQIKEVRRFWLKGGGERTMAQGADIERKEGR